LYDADNDGHIDKEELFQILKANLFEHPSLEMSEEDMRSLVDSTFDQVDKNGDGNISYLEYKSMVENSPSMIDYLTINIIPKPGEEDESLTLEELGGVITASPIIGRSKMTSSAGSSSKETKQRC
jgi:hypothetical protein